MDEMYAHTSMHVLERTSVLAGIESHGTVLHVWVVIACMYRFVTFCLMHATACTCAACMHVRWCAHKCSAPAQELVEESRLPHVRPANDGNLRIPHQREITRAVSIA